MASSMPPQTFLFRFAEACLQCLADVACFPGVDTFYYLLDVVEYSFSTEKVGEGFRDDAVVPIE